MPSHALALALLQSEGGCIREREIQVRSKCERARVWLVLDWRWSHKVPSLLPVFECAGVSGVGERRGSVLRNRGRGALP